MFLLIVVPELLKWFTKNGSSTPCRVLKKVPDLLLVLLKMVPDLIMVL